MEESSPWARSGHRLLACFLACVFVCLRPCLHMMCSLFHSAFANVFRPVRDAWKGLMMGVAVVIVKLLHACLLGSMVTNACGFVRASSLPRCRSDFNADRDLPHINIAAARAVDREFKFKYWLKLGWAKRGGGLRPPAPPASWGAAPPGPPKRRFAPVFSGG